MKTDIDLSKNKNLSFRNNPTIYLVDGKKVFISENYPLVNYNVINIAKYKKQKLNEKKSVKFNLNKNKIEYTYSKEEYDRKPSDDYISNLKTLQLIMKLQGNKK